MKKAFVISDVHLKKMASPQGEAILALLKRAQSECSLFIILGDLFDMWLGDGEYFKNKYSELIAEFKKLKSFGCRVIYFEGNHDLHLKKFWQDELGFEVYDKPYKFEFGGLKIWAEHGDEINRKDRDYLFLRWFLRTPLLRFLIYNVPSKIVGLIGERSSNMSRQYTSTLDNKSLEIFRDYALRLAELEDFDLIIAGHSHLQDDYEFIVSGKKRRLVNLGSWLNAGSAKVLEIESLGKFEIKSCP
ncbi:MAG: UDP-2,3-diacylglucosamine diphosphatase [Oligoflexia bacterium]|nr:UDP-2,3-diacylglucosamine diphosphatase [Oligoflexia bacterium]